MLPLLLACQAPTDPPASDTVATVADTGSTCSDGEAGVFEGLDFARLCAGSFTMGCTPGAGDCTEDEPVHRVTLTRDLWVSTTEVTTTAFAALVGYDPASLRCGADCPVETVAWSQAAAWTNALSEQAGLTSCYTCTGEDRSVRCAALGNTTECEGYRLPTEAEWEATARCGQDLAWAGADDPATVAWTSENAASTTHAVGSLAPNACGVYDMSGNVFEWTEDWYGPLDTSDVTDPVATTEGSYRSVRGGAWRADASYARVSLRSFVWPDYANYRIGFRVVRGVQPEE